MMESEIPLDGGNVNGAVVRVGNTVRRATSAISPTVHQFLKHLESKGFEHAPRFLGIDEQGREILSFVEGETGAAESIWQSDEPLIATADMLRKYHGASAGFSKDLSQPWGIVYPDESRHEVICHNDFAPYNFIFRNQIPHAVIDFDLIGPGPRLRDVAYAAYWLVPLSFHTLDQIKFTEADIAQKSRRLHLFCETYGITADFALLDMVLEVLTFMGDKPEVIHVLGEAGADKLERDGHLAHWQNEARTFQQHRGRIEANINP